MKAVVQAVQEEFSERRIGMKSKFFCEEVDVDIDGSRSCIDLSCC